MSATMLLTTTAPSPPKMTIPQRQKLYNIPHQQHSASSLSSPSQNYIVSPLSPHSPSTSSTNTRPSVLSSGAFSSTSSSCPRCGFASQSSSTATSPLFATDPSQSQSRTEADNKDVTALADARRQIDDLQAQVRLLNEKAMAAVEKWADYEDELVRLRKEVRISQEQQQQQQQQAAAAAAAAAAEAAAAASSLPPQRRSFLSANGAGARLSALWSPKSAPNLLKDKDSPLPSPALQSQHQRAHSSSSMPTAAEAAADHQTTDELLVALTREQHLRLTAEEKLRATGREVEELSASLFEQANEMVASERRARARLEERIETLEKRDAEKRRRLDRLESAVGRIERVRRLLDEEVV